jgi:hypothetical protein
LNQQEDEEEEEDAANCCAAMSLATASSTSCFASVRSFNQEGRKWTLLSFVVILFLSNSKVFV